MKKFVILCVIWAMVLPSCEKFGRAKAGMSANFNGTTYSMGYTYYQGSDRYNNILIIGNSNFEFRTRIKLCNENEYIWLSLYLREDSPLELKKTYQLKDIRNKQFGGFCYIKDNVPDFWNPYYYTEGQITFTKIKPHDEFPDFGGFSPHLPKSAL